MSWRPAWSFRVISTTGLRRRHDQVPVGLRPAHTYVSGIETGEEQIVIQQTDSAKNSTGTGRSPALIRATRAWARGLWEWGRSHKIKAALVLAALFVLVELLTIPYFDVARLRTQNPAETSLMRQRMREAEKERKPLRIRLRWVPLSRIPQHLIDAVVVAEDGTFYTHGGVDWFEVQESFERNIDERRFARGASTITQQLAKNLYLSTSKDPLRKAKELLITLLLEHFLSKNRILELYLNVIEWGRGIFGVDAAAQAYFGKASSALTLDEAVSLAAVIPSPLRHRPDVGSRYLAFRRQIVLRRLHGRNLVSPSLPQEEASHRVPPDRAHTDGAGQASDSAAVVDSADIEEEDRNGF